MSLRIALLQINTTAGDLDGNCSLILRGCREAAARGADLVVTPELALHGYLPRDLLMNRGFIRRSCEAAHRLARQLADGPPVLIGMATPNPVQVGKPLFNSAVLLENSDLCQAFHKTLLPSYDVFDEDRYFEPVRKAQTMERGGLQIGVSICEDIWNDADFWPQRRYDYDPIEALAQAGVQVVINLSASPFTVGKQQTREHMLAHTARKYRLFVLYVNQVGGNDDVIFDGRSCAFDPEGRLIARGGSFAEDIVLVDVEHRCGDIAADDREPEAEIWNALVLGIRDYLRKSGFSSVLLGLSGGIDSALTAALAVDAVGKECALGVLMPSPYSSAASVNDASELASNLGIRTLTLPIGSLMKNYENTLLNAFRGYEQDVTEENIQARIRGNLLMALSNKFGALLLTTGNKSELAVGYCTLYGDMSGGLAAIADLPKTVVYRVARWRNQRRPDIPVSILTKAPSAELRPDQTDQDTLPPYDMLDDILDCHIERCHSAEEIITRGHEPGTVRRVLRMVKNAEFKRKQAAPGLKVTSRAFGTGWRMPIVRQE